VKWYLMVWKKSADFSGRSRRKEYWMFFFFNNLIAFMLFIPGLILRHSWIGTIGFVLYIIYLLAIVVPSLAVSVRRLHDIGISGWLFLIILIPVVGPLILLVMMALEGNPGPNKYGSDPKFAEQYPSIV